MKKHHILSFVLLSFCFFQKGMAHNEIYLPQEEKPVCDLPKVFLLGQYEEEFAVTLEEYQANLLGTCANDFEVAYGKWMSMLQSIEGYAESIDYDLKGVKMWIMVLWSSDGTIDHIAYYLKPNSRNINTNELTAFFASFINTYKMTVTTDENFSHYSTASFPVFPVRASEK